MSNGRCLQSIKSKLNFFHSVCKLLSMGNLFLDYDRQPRNVSACTHCGRSRKTDFDFEPTFPFNVHLVGKAGKSLEREYWKFFSSIISPTFFQVFLFTMQQVENRRKTFSSDCQYLVCKKRKEEFNFERDFLFVVVFLAFLYMTCIVILRQT